MLVVSAAVITSWRMQVDSILTIIQGAVPMQFNTALLFALVGVDCVLRRDYRVLHRALPSIILTMAFATLMQDFTDIQSGIDTLFHDPHMATKTPEPGRMAPGTAICFICYGLARYRPGRDYSLWGLIISGMALVGYIMGIDSMVQWGPNVTAMAVHTAILFVAAFLFSLFCEFEAATVVVYDRVRDRTRKRQAQRA